MEVGLSRLLLSSRPLIHQSRFSSISPANSMSLSWTRSQWHFTEAQVPRSVLFHIPFVHFNSPDVYFSNKWPSKSSLSFKNIPMHGRECPIFLNAPNFPRQRYLLPLSRSPIQRNVFPVHRAANFGKTNYNAMENASGWPETRSGIDGQLRSTCSTPFQALGTLWWESQSRSLPMSLACEKRRLSWTSWISLWSRYVFVPSGLRYCLIVSRF
jgi:hypothetical protein